VAVCVCVCVYVCLCICVSVCVCLCLCVGGRWQVEGLPMCDPDALCMGLWKNAGPVTRTICMKGCSMAAECSYGRCSTYGALVAARRAGGGGVGGGAAGLRRTRSGGGDRRKPYSTLPARGALVRRAVGQRRLRCNAAAFQRRQHCVFAL
jgi:hypothetical protein